MQYKLKLVLNITQWGYVTIMEKRLQTFSHFSSPSTTGETEIDYFHQKVNIRVVSRVAEWVNIYDLRKFKGSRWNA